RHLCKPLSQHDALPISRHDRDHNEEELTIMVDHGLKVLDVIVEHAVYGELRGSLMMTSRDDVREFAQRIEAGEDRVLDDHIQHRSEEHTSELQSHLNLV